MIIKCDANKYKCYLLSLKYFAYLPCTLSAEFSVTYDNASKHPKKWLDPHALMDSIVLEVIAGFYQKMTLDFYYDTNLTLARRHYVGMRSQFWMM